MIDKGLIQKLDISATNLKPCLFKIDTLIWEHGASYWLYQAIIASDFLY